MGGEIPEILEIRMEKRAKTEISGWGKRENRDTRRRQKLTILQRDEKGKHGDIIFLFPIKRMVHPAFDELICLDLFAV